jgi:hypothetical protein
VIDELEQVEDFRADVPVAREEAMRAARAALTRAIDRDARRIAARRRRRRRTWMLRGAIAAAAAVLAGVAVDLAASGSATAPSPAVAAVFERLATVAAGGPATIPGRGRYLYVDSLSDGGADAYAGNRTCETFATNHGRSGSPLMAPACSARRPRRPRSPRPRTGPRVWR